MSAAIATTWDQLEPPARELAGRIAMLAGALTLEQVEEICLEDGDGIDVIAAADELIDAGLLQPVPADGEDCFGMSWPMRAYALEAQGSPDAEARLRRRLVELLARDRQGAHGARAAAVRRVPVAVAAAARAAADGDALSAGELAVEVAVRLGVDVQASLAGDAGSLARLFVALGERASREGDDGLAVVLALNAAWLADAARDPTARDLAMRLHRTSGADRRAAGGNGSESAGAIVVLDPADYGSGEGAVVGVRRRAGSRRVLATVLFSSLAPGEHEGRTDAEWIDLMARHDALVRRLITAARGQAIHATGYGFLSLFDGPATAIDCAVGIVDALRAIGVGARGGLHIGECDLIDDDVTGLAVNIAARVASHAGSGEVVTTEVVRDAAAGSGLTFVARGPHQLKGVPGEWPLFAVTPRSGPAR
jgi:class 3 adenylate cyclase